MPLFDFDGLFEKKLSEYMKRNAGKYTEEEWEDLIPKLYRKFGDTYVKSAKNTPNGCYREMGDEELVSTLRAHIAQNVPVSDFLLRELERRAPSALIPLIGDADRELSRLAIEYSDDSAEAVSACLALFGRETDEECRETALEKLKRNADEVAEGAVALYRKGMARALMTEILCRCKRRREDVLGVLLDALRTAETEEIPVCAAQLAAYGDERALPVLFELIEREETDFLCFRELKAAIEQLGGEYTRERDFSDDPGRRELERLAELSADEEH